MSSIRNDFIKAPNHPLTLRILSVFLDNNQNPDDPSLSSLIPSMSSQVDKNNQDTALCPVRAFMEYRAKSNEYRSPSQRALVIAVNKNYSTDIIRATLSRWLKTLICRTYLNLHQEGMLKSTTPIFPSGK